MMNMVLMYVLIMKYALLRSLNLIDRDKDQYSSSIRNKLGLMGVLDDYDENLLFSTSSKCVDENAVLINIQASFPPP